MNLSIAATDPEAPEVLPLLDALSMALAALTGDSGRSSFDPADMRTAGARFLVAHDASGAAVACGGYRPLQQGVAELKRMYARNRGAGAGSILLAALENAAAADGYRELWLETRVVNRRAIAFYLKHGYRQQPNFGRYVGRSEAACFGKTLIPAQAAV